jgi:hypothetical protein
MIRKNVGVRLSTQTKPLIEPCFMPPTIRARQSLCRVRSDDGACTNQAESCFARLQRAEFGIHHRISGQHLKA